MAAETPWIGLIALVAMFVIPLLPSWLFEGPATVRHRPRRHLCAVCDAPWTDGHRCTSAPGEAADLPLRGELARLDPSRPALEPRRPQRAR
jgi:hypothetical protein